MPHISISIRDPDDVIKTSVHKLGLLAGFGMILTFMSKVLTQRQACQQNETVCLQK
jgi:hypothetical protein